VRFRRGSPASHSAFVIEDTPHGRVLVVTGPWTRDAEAVVTSGNVWGLVLNYARGFAESDLSFLGAWPLRHLQVLDRNQRDLAPMARLGATLQSLMIDAAPGVRIDLDELPNLTRLHAGWDAVEATFHAPEALADVWLNGYHGSDLAALSTQPSIRRLEIVSAPLLESLDGVEELRDLEGLRIALARELKDLSAAGSVADTLVEFQLETCLGVDAIDEIAALSKLTLLGVKDCGRIESLQPIEGLRELRVFLAWESTRVMDNDLSPLLALPKLIEVRMRDRRDYRPRVAEVATFLAERT
jgi:hypothetical protein